jgi:transposase
LVFAAAAVERTMKLQEVILRALSGAISWLQAADILGLHPRSLRRWRARFERGGSVALYDRRTRRPSRRQAPAHEVRRILRLYRERFAGWNVRHFYRFAHRDHAVTLSYSFVNLALQEAGLVRKGRAWGRHRRRREPRGCFGELLHLDGSPHPWLRLAPAVRATLIAVVDDATTRLLYAQLWPAETTAAVFSALHAVFTTWGLPIALYTDRAHWAFHTPKAGGPVDRTHLTQVGRALQRLGIEHIGAYSPQARGRSERLNRTVQGRLVNELALAGITTLAAANTYLAERFMAAYNAEFARPPAEAATAFVPLHGVDLEAILCEHAERCVGQDNVVTLDTLALQIAKQPGRPTCAGLHVTVRRDLSGELSVWHGTRCFGRYDTRAVRCRPIAQRTLAPTWPRRYDRRPRRAPLAPLAGAGLTPDCRSLGRTKRTDHLSKPSGQITCQQHPPGRGPGGAAGGPTCRARRGSADPSCRCRDAARDCGPAASA